MGAGTGKREAAGTRLAAQAAGPTRLPELDGPARGNSCCRTRRSLRARRRCPPHRRSPRRRSHDPGRRAASRPCRRWPRRALARSRRTSASRSASALTADRPWNQASPARPRRRAWPLRRGRRQAHRGCDRVAWASWTKTGREEWIDAGTRRPVDGSHSRPDRARPVNRRRCSRNRPGRWTVPGPCPRHLERLAAVVAVVYDEASRRHPGKRCRVRGPRT